MISAKIGESSKFEAVLNDMLDRSKPLSTRVEGSGVIEGWYFIVSDWRDGTESLPSEVNEC